MKKQKEYLCLAIVFVIIIGIFLAYSQLSSSSNNAKVLFSEAVGKPAPNFSLESISGETIALSNYRGKNVVLFFNEGAMCYPACWNQMIKLAQDSRFNNEDIVSFSIVVDSKGEWEKIISQTPGFGEAKILFDTTKKVSSSYGVLTLPSSMHMGMMPGHTYVVIDKQGIIRYVLDDPYMGIRNDQLASEIEKLS